MIYYSVTDSINSARQIFVDESSNTHTRHLFAEFGSQTEHGVAQTKKMSQLFNLVLKFKMRETERTIISNDFLISLDSIPTILFFRIRLVSV